jgi:transposase
LGKVNRIAQIFWKDYLASLVTTFLSATVSRAADKWFISISVQMDTTPLKKSENQALVVGVDLGIKNLATLSNGETVVGRKPLKKLSRRLARLQRHLAKRTLGSKRYGRQKYENSTTLLSYELYSSRWFA